MLKDIVILIVFWRILDILEKELNVKIEKEQEERLKNLNEKIKNDEKFKNKLFSLKTIDEMQKYCCELNIDVTAGDLNLIFTMASDFIESINENDLGNVSGGVKVSKEQVKEFFKNNYGKLAVSLYFIWELVGHIVFAKTSHICTPLLKVSDYFYPNTGNNQ